MKKPAVFLDRDGVINRDLGYVYRPEDFQFIDGVFRLAAAVNRAGYALIVATNQAGVARGYYSEGDVNAVHDWLQQEFRKRGAEINAFYFCPYHPEASVPQYRMPSPNRKPEPEMILQAALDWSLDLARSVLVGDKESDMAAGRRAQVGTLVLFDPALDTKLATHGDRYKVGSLNELAGYFEALTPGSFPSSPFNELRAGI